VLRWRLGDAVERLLDLVEAQEERMPERRRTRHGLGEALLRPSALRERISQRLTGAMQR
jgi:hypothetical protein